MPDFPSHDDDPDCQGEQKAARNDPSRGHCRAEEKYKRQRYAADPNEARGEQQDETFVGLEGRNQDCLIINLKFFQQVLKCYVIT
ncbi:MAG: hypothetical protein ABI600_02225 [Luteolibacter sp.]